MSILAYLNIGTISSPAFVSQQNLERVGSVRINIPDKKLANKSLQVTTLDSKSYLEYSSENSYDVYTALQKTIAIWKKYGLTDQYLVYGKHQSGDTLFNWEIVPYYKSSTVIGRIWQQFVVLWKVTFGSRALSNSEQQKELNEYQFLFRNFIQTTQENIPDPNTIAIGNDAFCKKEVINKQRVLEGKLINVLYNYAPIGFGGERLHFLIIPKKHKVTFSALSKDEYLEAICITQKLMNHFSTTREIKSVYFFHKSGVDAGQTVPHWHMHMVLTSNETQDLFGKLSVLKNMLIGSSPMKDDELRKKIDSLCMELKPLQKNM